MALTPRKGKGVGLNYDVFFKCPYPPEGERSGLYYVLFMALTPRKGKGVGLN